MNEQHRIKRIFAAGLGAAAIAIAGCAGMMSTKHVNVSLSGSEQVPPVNTAARGSGSFAVHEDHSVSGSVTVSGLVATAAHIHVGARGKNGPVAIGLNKSSDTEWVVPAGAKFNEAQYKSFMAGETYVNFHTAANKGGEIRAQLQP
jgi:hypothetical protein